MVPDTDENGRVTFAMSNTLGGGYLVSYAPRGANMGGYADVTSPQVEWSASAGSNQDQNAKSE